MADVMIDSPSTKKEEMIDPSYDSAASLLAVNDERQPVSLALILHTLYGGRRLIQIVTLATVVLAAVVAFLLPQTYTSSATILPPGVGTSSSMSALLGQASAMGAGALLGSGGKSQGELYVAVLKSRSVQTLMVNRFHLVAYYKVKSAAGAARQLLKNSTFDVGMKDPLVTITTTDHSPAMARDLTEGYLQALQETDVRLALTESSQRRAFFEQRLEREKEALADAEVNFQKSQKQTGLIAPAGQTATQIQTLANVQAEITSRQVQMASLLQSETEDAPDVIGIRREIQTLQAKAKELENGQERKNFGGFSASQVPTLQMEYIRSAREVKYHETLFDIIAKQYEAARLDEAKEAPVQILDHANLPESPSGPRRKLIIAIGFIAGLTLASAYVLIRHVFPGEKVS